jgi:hypothetical protein
LFKRVKGRSFQPLFFQLGNFIGLGIENNFFVEFFAFFCSGGIFLRLINIILFREKEIVESPGRAVFRIVQLIRSEGLQGERGCLIFLGLGGFKV